MIEKLDPWQCNIHPDISDHLTFVSKLNEVIEAVNRQQMLLDYWMVTGATPTPAKLPYEP